MAFDYEELYRQTPQALGTPNRELMAFIKKIALENARVLDVGCGQGRDALFLARLGHRVVGVDLSPSGVRDMLNVAKSERLSVVGQVVDITSFSPAGEFEVMLFDRTLHMLDEPARFDVLKRYLDHVVARGWVLIIDESRNVARFRRILADDRANWQIEREKRGYLFAQRH